MGYEHRVKILQEKIQELELCGVILFYSRDVLYYTGTAQPSYLAVLPQEYFLFVRNGFEFALDDAFIPKERIKEEGRLENIHKEAFSKPHSSNRVGTELDLLPARQLYDFKKAFPGYEFLDVSAFILEQRQTKDALRSISSKRLVKPLMQGTKRPCQP